MAENDKPVSAWRQFLAVSAAAAVFAPIVAYVHNFPWVPVGQYEALQKSAFNAAERWAAVEAAIGAALVTLAVARVSRLSGWSTWPIVWISALAGGYAAAYALTFPPEIWTSWAALVYLVHLPALGLSCFVGAPLLVSPRLRAKKISAGGMLLWMLGAAVGGTAAGGAYWFGVLDQVGLHWEGPGALVFAQSVWLAWGAAAAAVGVHRLMKAVWRRNRA